MPQLGDPRARRGSADPTAMRSSTGYMPIEDYGLIGNMRMCALVASDGGLDYMCWPEFDSPSVFCRILDKDKGGHFTICPASEARCTTKQQYLPNSTLLQTRYLNDEGVMNVVDFFPRPYNNSADHDYSRNLPDDLKVGKGPLGGLKKWLIRRVQCMRGEVDVAVEVHPAFNYARDPHTTEIREISDCIDENEFRSVVIFKSDTLSLELHATVDCGDDKDAERPTMLFQKKKGTNGLGDGITTTFRLREGQAVSFILRDHPAEKLDPVHITTAVIDQLQMDTQKFWLNWISKSNYRGRWQQVIARSFFILKLLTYEPTGAIVAAPTFSLPEDIGGTRNWDYRFSWVRDSSFTIYILLRMGFADEADAYLKFISDRLKYSRTKEGALPIMFTIRGETDIPEVELSHLDGYRGSKPVRIGNGAAFHTQLDIYGELMDGIYLSNKYGKPISYDMWVSIREVTDFVCKIWKEKDMSIWEVRGEMKNFVYSKIMLWVAIDRALRLADKRGFPCLQRLDWLRVRDEIYEDVMDKGYNKELQTFVQSYEDRDILDSAVLIAPLVFFISPNDPRFLSTLDRILLPPEKGGLTSTGLVYRYNYLTSDDGVGGREGAFSMCTFWLVEALTRAGVYEPKYHEKAVNLFENALMFRNHLDMYSEEIAGSGEQLGNTPQAFSHLALISAAFNLDRTDKAW